MIDWLLPLPVDCLFPSLSLSHTKGTWGVLPVVVIVAVQWGAGDKWAQWEATGQQRKLAICLCISSAWGIYRHIKLNAHSVCCVSLEKRDNSRDTREREKRKICKWVTLDKLPQSSLVVGWSSSVTKWSSVKTGYNLSGLSICSYTLVGTFRHLFSVTPSGHQCEKGQIRCLAIMCNWFSLFLWEEEREREREGESVLFARSLEYACVSCDVSHE